MLALFWLSKFCLSISAYACCVTKLNNLLPIFWHKRNRSRFLAQTTVGARLPRLQKIAQCDSACSKNTHFNKFLLLLVHIDPIIKYHIAYILWDILRDDVTDGFLPRCGKVVVRSDNTAVFQNLLRKGGDVALRRRTAINRSWLQFPQG